MGNCTNSNNEQRRERLQNKKNSLKQINEEGNKENIDLNSANINKKDNNLKPSLKNEENNYYLICPDCLMRSPHIEKLYYDENLKEFLVKYTCICNNISNPKKITL